MTEDKQSDADKIVGSTDGLGGCQHEWVSNSGKGGDPRFKLSPGGHYLLAHVRCSLCGDRTWLTESQWLKFCETPNDANEPSR